MGDADRGLGPGGRGTGDERCEEISSPSLLTYPTRHRTLYLSSIVLYVCIFPWQGCSPVTCTSAIPMWKRRQSGPSCECRQMSSEHDGASWSPGRDLETRGHTIGNHITLLSALSPSQAIVSPLGPRIMSLGVLKAARNLIGSSHRSADPHG